MKARGWIFLISGTALFIWLFWILTPIQVVGYDGGFYQAMTQQPFSNSPRVLTAPYAFRVLPAWLLSLIPGPTLTIYTIYNALTTFLTVLIYFDFLKKMGFGVLGSGIAVFIFLSSWVNLRFSFYNPIHIDTTYYLILALAFYSLVRDQTWLFWGCLVAGAATREYFITLLVVYYLHYRKQSALSTKTALIKTVLLGLVPGLIFIWLRVWRPISNSDFNYFEHLLYFGRIFLIYWPRMIHAFFNVFGVGAFIIILGIPACFSLLRRLPWVSAYLFCSLVFFAVGGTDRCRILFTAWPAILILVANAVREQRSIYRQVPVLVFISLLQGILMRWHIPITPDNYRHLWWSNISFLPRIQFLRSSREMMIAGISFALVFFGNYLRLGSSPRDS